MGSSREARPSTTSSTADMEKPRMWGRRQAPTRVHDWSIQAKWGAATQTVSSREAGPRIGSFRATMEKQTPRGRRPTPLGALDRSIQGTRGEASRDSGVGAGDGQRKTGSAADALVTTKYSGTP